MSNSEGTPDGQGGGGGQQTVGQGTTGAQGTTAASSEAVTAAVFDAYKRLLSYQFGGTLLLIVILGLALWFSGVIWKSQPPLLLLIMLGGMLGAFFSALTRLYNVDRATVAIVSPTVSKLGKVHLLIYSLVPPIVGAIAALVLYIAFAGDVLQGGVFPKIICKDGQKCDNLYDTIQNYGPNAAVDYARALMWSFIAGFSERFVPDTLLTLVTKQQENN